MTTPQKTQTSSRYGLVLPGTARRRNCISGPELTPNGENVAFRGYTETEHPGHIEQTSYTVMTRKEAIRFAKEILATFNEEEA